MFLLNNRTRVLCGHILLIGFSFSQFSFCHAQDVLNLSSTTSKEVLGTFATQIEMREGEVVHDGDLVSYDPSSGKYVLTQIAQDPYLYGVITLNPIIYSHDINKQANTYPVVRFGEVLVNVSTINGEIRAGDLVTSSRVVGLGQRFDGSKPGQLLGIAVSETVYESTALDIEGTTVRLGRIPVGLRIGYYASPGSADTSGVASGTAPDIASPVERLSGDQTTPNEQSDQTEILTLIRYLLGGLVMLGSFVVALNHFGGYYKEGIIAVGRNPLAHQQIRSLVVWNTFMVILIAGAGFVIGMMIMFV